MSTAQELNTPPSTPQDFQRLKCLVEQSTSTRERFRLGRQLAELNKLAEQGKAITERWGKWHAALLKDQQQIEKRQRNLPALESFSATSQRAHTSSTDARCTSLQGDVRLRRTHGPKGPLGVIP